MRDTAIRNTHPSVRTVLNETNAFDVENTPVVLDETLITAEIARLEALEPWNKLRDQRNSLIAETDWTANSDVVMTDEMRTYRQALRDLPANTADPVNPTWPEL
jgi:hypothetical protein